MTKQLWMSAFHLQFITPEAPFNQLLLLVKQFLAGGGRWIQLRLKDPPEKTVIEIASEVAKVCRLQNAIFILNDYVHLVNRVGAHGVHLGKTDMTIMRARQILGNHAIIGGTANTLDDLKSLINNGADYAGLGPYRFTKTKKNLSPVIGIEGYHSIMDELIKLEPAFPVVAIGGIELDDVTPIIKSRVNGLAVSATISCAEDPELITRLFLETIRFATTTICLKTEQ